jgi:hypothetical protein
MQVNSLVECIHGYPGIIEEGSLYTVTNVSKHGILVAEAAPPSPYTSFFKDRFKEVQPPTDITSIINEIQIKELC